MEKRIWSIVWIHRQTLLGGVIVSVVFFCCAIGLFGSYDPIEARLANEAADQWPSWRFWLGTDRSGQSILRLLIEGTKAFFVPGLFATAIAVLGGCFMGSVSGFYGGMCSNISRYISTLINSFPNLVLVILCVTVFGPDIRLIAGVVGVTFVPHIAADIYRKVVQLKAEEFILAAEAHGLSDLRIILFHILWLHCLPMIMRQVMFLWSYIIMIETSLNYLGKGVLQKGISWGKMLYEYRGGLFRGHYWSPLIVTAAVMLSMSGFYFLAEGLQSLNREGR